MMTVTPRLLLLCLLTPGLLAVSCVAQSGSGKASAPQMPASANKLIAIKVSGTKRYTQEDVVAASGLLIGGAVSDEDFRKTARQLGDSGAFSDVAYSFSYSSTGTKLALQVTDSDKFLPVHFDDFVWFSDDELKKKIHERVPLFNGELPLFGRLPDQVSDVLQALLVEINVPGHVDYLRNAGPGGKIESINYSISDVLIRVRNVEFTGAKDSELPLLQVAARRLPDREYSRHRMNLFAERDLLPIYHAHGYLKATLGQPQPKVIKQTAADKNDDPRGLTLVDVTLPVDPGPQYKLLRVEWSGNRELPSEKLQSMVHVQIGRPADAVQLASDLEEVKRLYGSRGYLNATIKIDPQVDDSAATVTYRLDVREDYVYRMGELDFRGIDNNLIAKLRAVWKLRQGDVYDSGYLREFLGQSGKLLPPNFDWGIETHVTPNTRDKTVDVEIHYTVKAPQ